MSRASLTSNRGLAGWNSPGILAYAIYVAVLSSGCQPQVSSDTKAPPREQAAESDKPAAGVPLASEPLPDAATTSPESTPAPTASTPAAALDDEIPLKVASWAQTKEIVASHKGKVVVLDLWSTYCPPCLKEFPELVKLQQKHGDKIVCLSLNCNYVGDGSPDADRPDILKVLKRNNAKFQNLISSDPDEELYKKVGIASIPVVQVYGADGQLSKQFDNEKNEFGESFTYADHIGPYVEKLVNAQSQ